MTQSPPSPPPMPPPMPPPAPPPLPQRMEDSAGMRLLLPVGTSGLAIAAGYVGSVSVLVVPAPLALLLGIFAIRSIRKSRRTPHPKHGMGRAIFGIVVGGAFTALLLAILVGFLVNRMLYND